MSKEIRMEAIKQVMQTFRLPFLFFLLLVLGRIQTIVAQTVPLNKEEMGALLDKNLGRLETGNFAMRFHGIAMNVPKPLDIFSLPSYKVFRGGYYYCDNNKFELSTGAVKALCDGKVLVLIDEVNHQVMIDSINQAPAIVQEGMSFADMRKYIGPGYDGEGVLSYLGLQKVQGKNCHAIQLAFPGEEGKSSIYYVSAKDERLLLMAEKRQGAYDVYWLEGIGPAPGKHVYTIQLPKRELHTLYGYEVTDLRF